MHNAVLEPPSRSTRSFLSHMIPYQNVLQIMVYYFPLQTFLRNSHRDLNHRHANESYNERKRDDTDFDY